MHAIRSTLLALLCPTILCAQTPPCASLNDANNTTTGNVTAYGFSGENTRAWQYTPTATIPAFAIQLMTGNTALSGDRYMTVEIWDDANGLPGTRLGGGTWKISAALAVDWQGTNFDRPVVLTQNTPYWIVWIDPGFSEIPEETGGMTLPTARRSGAVWSALGVGALKFRLFCSYLDGANVQQNGSPCPHTGGNFGTLFTNQLPQVGNGAFQLEGSGFDNGVLALLVIGVNPTWPSVAIPGLPTSCQLHTDDAAVTIGITGTGNTRGPTAAGHVVFPIGIPANPALTGFYLGAQLAGFDSGAAVPLPFAVSNGLRITVQ